MGKKFWIVVIAFWLALLIAGYASYLYIDQMQEDERKEFIFNYVYAEDNEKAANNINLNYEKIPYTEDDFIKKALQMHTDLSSVESEISAKLATKDPEVKKAALSQSIKAYQSAKNFIPQFANIELQDTSLLQRKRLEKLATYARDYIQAHATYFVISANAFKTAKRPSIDEDMQHAKANLQAAKASFLEVLDPYMPK